jgi:hypothetical protein
MLVYRTSILGDLIHAEGQKISLTRVNVRRHLREHDRFPPMSARERFLSGLGSIVVALAGFLMVGALPAAATNSGTVQYVALGDSYAAGQGAGSYLNSCLQSTKGYPELLDPEKRIRLQTNATCTGATTSDVATTQLRSLNRDTRLVTLTVGGNDLDVSGVATTCTTGTPAACQAAINNALASLAVGQGGESVLGGRLTELYADIAAGAAQRASCGDWLSVPV